MTTSPSDRFDLAPNRRNGDSIKWNQHSLPDRDVIGAGLGDMDFQPPPAVINSVMYRTSSEALGYSAPAKSLIDVFIGRLERLYGWSVDPEWLVLIPGVVPALYVAAAMESRENDYIITQTPNYPHLFDAAKHAGKQVLGVGHRQESNGWAIDFDQLESYRTYQPSSFLLCNPHNPIGKVLTKSELSRIADFCLENSIRICSDEVFSDLVLDQDKRHVPIASLSDDIANISITLMSPSKTFNIAGIGGFAFAIIPNAALRKEFYVRKHGTVVPCSALAYSAALAAYRDCQEWHEGLLDYLRTNRIYLQERISRLDGLSMSHVEATFFGWLDVSDLNTDSAFEHFRRFGVALSDGSAMGDERFVRLNFGCTRQTLKEIIDRIEQASTRPSAV